MTRWSPDTCDCVIEYDANLVVTAVITRCAKHASASDDATHLATVLAHNRKKNLVLNASIDHMKKVGSAIPPEAVSVTYDANDALHITGTGLSAKEQAALLAMLSPGLGATVIKAIS